MREETSLYRPVLKSAFTFAWRQKRWWIFAFFASLLMSGGIYDLAARRWADATARSINSALPEAIALPTFPELVTSFQTGESAFLPPWMLAAIAVTLVLAIVFLWLAVTSQGALIAAASGELKGGEPLRSALGSGATRFWPLFWINLGSKLLLAFIIFLLGLPAAVLAAGGTGAGTFVVTFFLGIPAVLMVSFISLYAMTAVVVRDEGAGGAIAHAWHTFTTHWLVSLEMAFIILAIDALAALAISLALFVIAAPFVLLVLAASALGSAAGFYFVFSAMAIAMLGFIFAAGSFLTALRYGAWTMLFIRCEKRRAVSKLFRILRVGA